MKTRFYLGVLALLFVVAAAGFADQAADEYDVLMKPAVAAAQKLGMSMRAGDLSAAAMDAGDVKTRFAAIEQYWTMKNMSDAAMFAKNIEDAAADLQTAASSGNKDAATAAQMKIFPNCGGCHMAHRMQNPDKTYSIK